MATRRHVLTMLGGAATLPVLGASSRAQAQWAPSRPMRMVVAYPAGGATDAIARIVANDISGPLGQNVIVENVPGASGAIGTRQVARAEPDGHTICFSNNQAHASNMFLMRSPGYDAVKDFAPLAGVGAFENVLVVRNGLAAKSVAELVALAKAKPGEINYASTGPGSGSHLATELFMIRTGAKMTHVPYRGLAPLTQDLVGDRLDVAITPLAGVLALIEAGSVRALAMASAARNPKLPNLATMAEEGVSGAELSSWTGFFAPATAPPASVTRLSAEVLASLRKPAISEAIDKLGFTVQVRDAQAFAAYQVETMKVLEVLIRSINLTIEQ